MSIELTQSVRQIVTEIPEIIPVFQRFGIDFCCGGEKSLSVACQDAKIPAETVLSAFEDLKKLSAARSDEKNWSSEPLSALLDHIKSTHHAFTRNEIARIEKLLSKVPDKHGEKHPELYDVREVFQALAAELSVHLMKEEQILFPYIVRLEEAQLSGEPAPPSTCFGSVENPIRMMEFEHASAGDELRELRRLSNDYQPPEDACDGYRSLYSALADFEKDLHLHIHKENNILHPRALQAERSKVVNA